MIWIGISMRNKKIFLGLFSIFFITPIFTNENEILWDFGVIINTSVNHNDSENILSPLSNLEIEPSSQTNALIADPFIPPTLISTGKKRYKPQFFSESLNVLSLNNINQVKLFASRLTMQTNYQLIIDIISQINFSIVDKNDTLDLMYWLANALLYTGKYKEAEDVIHANMPLAIDDRFHFLLAMTYEVQGKKKESWEEYLKFIKQFPQSDYKMAALIKSRILDRFK